VRGKGDPIICSWLGFPVNFLRGLGLPVSKRRDLGGRVADRTHSMGTLHVATLLHAGILTTDLKTSIRKHFLVCFPPSFVVLLAKLSKGTRVPPWLHPAPSRTGSPFLFPLDLQRPAYPAKIGWGPENHWSKGRWETERVEKSCVLCGHSSRIFQEVLEISTKPYQSRALSVSGSSRRT
jgi:hypothetical protein